MQATVTAVMAGGQAITEQAADFVAFVDLLLGFRKDAGVRRVTWTVAAPVPSADPALRPQAA